MRASCLYVHVLIVFCFLISVSPGYASADFPTPPNSESWWVTTGSVHNGHYLSVKRFASRFRTERVIDYYKRIWSSDDEETPGYIESSVHGWRIISRLSPQAQWVVQVRDSSIRRGSEGLISKMSLEKHPPVARTNSMKFTSVMNGGKLLSTTDSAEPVAARTHTQLFTGRPESVAMRYKKYLLDDRWALQDEFVQGATVTQRFERQSRYLDIALVEISYGKTLVLVNEVVREKK